MASHQKCGSFYIFLIVIATILLPGLLCVSFFKAQPSLKSDVNLVVSAKNLDLPIMISKPSDKWQLIYVSYDTCEENCNNVIKTLFQVKRALGDSAKNVKLKHVFPGFIKDRENQANFNVSGKIYLVNPVDNSVIYYAETTDPMAILQDLNKILHEDIL